MLLVSFILKLVPPLKGFIMNKAPQGFEKVLYDLLLVSDERTSVSELSTVLEQPLELIKKAVSILCRLNFAKKKVESPVITITIKTS
jgi:hypothetical protein